MSKQQNFIVCKRCGKIKSESDRTLFADIRNGDIAKLHMCKDCKFSFRNLYRAIFKKEEK